MRFVDEATILVKAGKGGNGAVSFKREKFKPKGGPDGGDGGHGGSITLKASDKLLTLYDFRLKRNYEAENGIPGQGSQCYGRKGENLTLELPVGTQVFEITDDCEKLITDLAEKDFEYVVVQGGMGGKGNEHFKTSTMRTPRFAQPGEAGEEKRLRLELKILADVGLLGLPNAGKSTLISKLSAAKPKIASYPFTTLVPNLGVVIDEYDPNVRLVIADIPGLIEGAHSGLGLGHRFLKHIERNRFLVHICSIEDLSIDDPWAAFDLLNTELELFDETLAKKKQIEVINKIDIADPEKLAAIKQAAKDQNRNVFFISAMEKIGLEELSAELWKLFNEIKPVAPLVKLREVVKIEVGETSNENIEEDEEEIDNPTEFIWVRERL